MKTSPLVWAIACLALSDTCLARVLTIRIEGQTCGLSRDELSRELLAEREILSILDLGDAEEFPDR